MEKIMELEKLSGNEIRGEIALIRANLKSGAISYDEAKVLAAPVIAEMERRGAAIAKKFNKRAPRFSFVGLMR